MFLDFYRLREQPFGVTPNPHFLYLGASHREALASLCYGVKTGRGLLALIAPPGMGKTTLLFRFLAHVRRSARTAFLFQTQCDSNGLLHYMLRDLGIDTHGMDFVTMHDRLNVILLEEAHAGRRFVLVIDEAQNLSDAVLETARLLTDFETPNEKLLQIVFAGQPQLAERLNRPELIQLRQRISILGRLRPFSPTEVAHYIHHRLQVAGHRDEDLFTPAALERIAFRTQGIPRNINNICFNSLSLGCALGRKKIDVDLIEEVTGDLDLGSNNDAGPQTLQAAGPSPEPRTDRIHVRGFDATADVSPQNQATQERRDFGDRSNLQHKVSVSEDRGALTLEALEEAERRGAEILAEVVDLDAVVEHVVLRSCDDIDDFRREGVTPTDQYGKKPELNSASLPVEISTSDQASCFPLPYSHSTKSETKRWALVAAMLVLIALVALPYLQGLRALSAKPPSINFKPVLITSVNAALIATRSAWNKASVFVKLTPALSSLIEHSALPNASGQLGQRLPKDTAPSPPTAAAETQLGNNLITVTVKPNDDLRQICLRNLGKFDQYVVEEIRELNPSVTNPDQIIVGKRIVLPRARQNENNSSLPAKTKQ